MSRFHLNSFTNSIKYFNSIKKYGKKEIGNSKNVDLINEKIRFECDF